MKAPPGKTMEIVKIGEKSGRMMLRVMAPWEIAASDYDDTVDEYSRVRIAGFRSGKAPRYVVEKRFQCEIMHEFSRRCGRFLAKEALSQAGAEPMGLVEISDIACGKGKPFQFIASFSPMPEIDLPDLGSLVARTDGTDPRDLISNRLLEMVRFKVPDELISTELGPDNRDDMDQESMEWKAAEKRVRLMLILKRIARQEGIEVDEVDVEKRIKEKAVEFGTNPGVLKTELEKGGGMERLKDMLLAESTLDFLIEKARGTNVVDSMSKSSP